MNDLVARAREFAISGHARINQLRKYSQQPYDVHLRAVAGLVASVTDDQAMIAAAWLHDVVEDTPATFDDIEREFGADVGGLVRELTDVSRPTDGNRTARKKLDRGHLARGSPRAKTIKLADIIDNAADICRHDLKFGRVFLTEAQALMEILREGDPTLYDMAEAGISACVRKVEANLTAVTSEPPGVLPTRPRLAGNRGIRLFAEAFSARDIHEPLLSFDEDSLPTLSRDGSLPRDALVIGIRRDGLVFGYAHAVDGTRIPSGGVRPIDREQIVSLEIPLADVIHVLTHFEFCFVAVEGVTVGVIGRKDIEKPVVRMWLFGIIILAEMLAVELIRGVWPDEAWLEHVSEGRLAKARELREERVRRGLPADLLDCLQFSDKMQIVLRHPPFLETMGFASVNTARKTVKDLESLRNNLAHGQDITRHDWPQIVRLARRIQSLVAG